MTNAILGALLNGAIVGALLALAIQVALLLAPRRVLSAAARYAVWWTTLAAAVLLPLAYLPLRPVPRAVAAGIPPALAAPLAATPFPAPAPPAPFAATYHSVAGIRWRFPVVFTVGAWSRWILAAWAALSALLLLRLATSCLLLARRKSAAVAAPEQLTAAIEAALARRGSARRAPVLRSANIGMPVLAGLARPAILIPERLFSALTPEELLQVGLHEAAHLARRDDYALLGVRAVQALFPLHPVVLWIARQIDLEREIACDDFVLESAAAPRRYAACLLRVMELCGGARRSWAAAGMAGGRSQLTRRVESLLDHRREARMPAGKARLSLAIAAVAVLACLAGRTPRALALAPPEAPPSPQTALPMPAPLQAAATPRRAAPQPAAPPVLLPLTVQDAAHRYVPGLDKNSFQVLEDGVEQKVSELSVDNPPLSVELVVDRSGSMQNKQALIDAAVTGLVSAANPADEFLVVTFNDEADMAGPFANNTGQILNQLHLGSPRGGTALRDALQQAAEWKSARYPDRIVVAISDGVDNSSSLRTEELRGLASAAKTPIWAITLASQDAPRRGSLWLRDLTEQSAGHEFVSDDPGQVGGIAATIANQTRYVLKYNSTHPARDGRYRNVAVNIVNAPPGAYKISARLGYYAAGQ